jgi:hypothetical protein
MGVIQACFALLVSGGAQPASSRLANPFETEHPAAPHSLNACITLTPAPLPTTTNNRCHSPLPYCRYHMCHTIRVSFLRVAHQSKGNS